MAEVIIYIFLSFFFLCIFLYNNAIFFNFLRIPKNKRQKIDIIASNIFLFYFFKITKEIKN
jgi:hypothetical protein